MTITKEEEEIEGNEHVQDEKMEDAQEVKGEEETTNVEAKDIKKDEIVETNACVEEEVKAAVAVETNDMKNDEIVETNACVEEKVKAAEAVETNDMKNDEIVEDTNMKDKEEEKTLIFRIALAFSILVGSNLILVLSSALLCAYIGPAAAGSGIPEVKAYLNGIDAPNILALNTLIVKVFLTISSYLHSRIGVLHFCIISFVLFRNHVIIR